MKTAAALFLIAQAVVTPKFEVASVRMGAPLVSGGTAGMTGGGPGTDSPGRFTGRLVTLEQLIELAFDVRLFQISGPSWIFGRETLENRYDIGFILDPTATKAQFQRMMQDLLAERFHFKFHRETKVLPAYQLVLADGGAKLKESKAPSFLSTTPTKGGVRLSSRGGIALSRIIPYLQPHLDNYQLVDSTGLTGTYEISLEFVPMDRIQRRVAMELSGITSDEGFVFPSLSTALQEQLGLRLVKGTAPFEVIVVDSGDKVPTEN